MCRAYDRPNTAGLALKSPWTVLRGRPQATVSRVQGPFALAWPPSKDRGHVTLEVLKPVLEERGTSAAGRSWMELSRGERQILYGRDEAIAAVLGPAHEGGSEGPGRDQVPAPRGIGVDEVKPRTLRQTAE